MLGTVDHQVVTMDAELVSTVETTFQNIFTANDTVSNNNEETSDFISYSLHDHC
jgi:hypothetical protein